MKIWQKDKPPPVRRPREKRVVSLRPCAVCETFTASSYGVCSSDECRRRHWTERAEAICALRAQGMTLAAIGERFGLTRERVRQIVRDAGLTDDPRSAAAQRERNRQIGELARDGLTKAGIGERYGLSAHRVGEIIHAAGLWDAADAARRARRTASRWPFDGEVIARYRDGQNQTDIGAQLGMTQTQVSKIICDNLTAAERSKIAREHHLAALRRRDERARARR